METVAQSARLLMLGLALVLAGCGGGGREAARPEVSRAGLHPNETSELRALIEASARRHGVPDDLVQRVVIRESRHVPGARNGSYWGLMQLRHDTARTMGYRGPPEGLLDARTNLEYGVRYLRGAWLVSDGDRDAAVGWYARGYYYEAKRLGMLEATGLR